MLRTAIAGLLILLLCISGCKTDTGANEIAIAGTDLTDLKYGSHASQSMDMFLPGNRNGNTRTIVFVHGGFWIGGDKAQFTALAKTFRDKGYASAVINYRLSNTPEKNIHPTQVNDLASAIAFIQSRAGEWKISPDDLSLLGASAGGHLALLYAYAYDAGHTVKAVISMAGPSNLMNMQSASPQQAQVVRWFLGTDAQSSPTIYQQASPLSHVTANTNPTLLLHGKLDVIVPYEQSLELKSKLDQFSVKNKLIIYENLGHEDDLNAIPNLVSECESWLSEN